MSTTNRRATEKGKTLQRRHIAALIAVGESQSVHAAARAINMPQPALSRLLSEAEQILSARLFDRSSQGCAPTAQGQLVLAQARFVMRGLDELGSITSDARPMVRLGCIPRAMYTFMPRLLNRLYPAGTDANSSRPSSAPGPRSFDLNVMEGSSAALLDALGQGRLDFAVIRSVSSSPGDGPDLLIERLYDDKIVIICATANPLPENRTVPLRELMSHQWVLPDTRTTSRLAFDNFLRENGLSPIKPVMEVRSFEANLALVADTRFLSIAPESIARRYVKMGLRMARTKPALPSSPVMLACHASQLQSPTLQTFHDLLIGAASDV